MFFSLFRKIQNYYDTSNTSQLFSSKFYFLGAQQPPVGQSLLIHEVSTRVGTLIVATIYLQLIQNRYMIRSFTVLQCSHQHCVQPVASDVEVVGYL